MRAKQDAFWSSGIRFQCQGSGKCCVSRGEYGFVYLTLEDRRRFAKYFRLSTSAFTRKFCRKTDGFWAIKDNPETGNCRFLEAKKCSVYMARPTQCRTWPFWPEVMNAKSWKKEVATFCPGVGKGPVVDKVQIERQMKAQERSELELDREALSQSGA